MEEQEKKQNSLMTYKAMGLNAMQTLLRVGTEEQIAKLHNDLEAAGYKWDPIGNKPIPLDAELQSSEKMKAYARHLWHGGQAKGKALDIKDFINHRMKRTTTDIPQEITYENVKSLMWKAYRHVIYNQTKIEVKSGDVDEYSRAILKNITHWIIGSENGDWDPTKSLYIYGGLGVGKSSVVEAIHFVYGFLRAQFSWSSRYMDFQSMEALFLESLSADSMKAISRFCCGGWILDDIKPEMYLVNHYGNEIQLINRILHSRHEIWRTSGWQTIITSNTPWESLIHPDHLNDKRLMDRIKQQYIPVEYKGTNKRNPKFRLKP